MKKILFLFPALLFFSFSAIDDQKDKYAVLITSADLKTNLSVIASDAYEGRETGERGLDSTAAYIARQFKSYGIPELPSGGYFQKVPLIKYIPGNGSVSCGNKNFSFGKDFYYTSGIEDGKTKTTELVFAGYGIQDSAYWDYATPGKTGVDAKGKTVMILTGEPVDKNGNSLITGTQNMSTWTSYRRRKINQAKKMGASAVLMVLPDYAGKYAENAHYIDSPTLKLDEPTDAVRDTNAAPSEMHVLYISESMAEQMLTEAGSSGKILKAKKIKHCDLKTNIVIDIQRHSVKLNSENVLGFLEGSDLKNEIVVISAHMDHLGKDSTVVFNGADDDGSGTVAVLQLAKAFAKAKSEGHGPRRSILFITMTGEEKGLLGSKWYTGHPVFPLENTVCDLNIDMIGRIDTMHTNAKKYVYVIGSDMLSSELKKLIESNNNSHDQLTLDYRYDDPDDPNSYYTRSDHYNFAKNKIPVAFFFNGTHADYHKETDEISKIDFDLLAMRARLVFCTAWDIADRDQRLVVDKGK
ncbi:MAG TPA: M28 family peptidase [Bacteroidia bacterium]|jgi:hypothetical protein|nr:M28 family peptidase [Bacteroidia bacterium]